MRGTDHQEPSKRQNGAMSPDDWREYCQQVGAAAEQLRLIALRAESAALSAGDRDPMHAIARDIGLIPASNAKAQTFATMMLGPFAALEELRRQIRT